ncbi:unnamed protein product [Clonostachys rhizophaga]|uniref:Glucose-methanol-choline oxidoreductase C-terminal domain-containing protein n=1 Tax=Clonostachys rhizophaga TaxID=160324 RepID=A0A9N9VG64_9HYPO|nr:unnamed protein product [Clonostachys rhizophaga]
MIQAGDEPIVEYVLFHGQTNTVIYEPNSLIDYLAPRKRTYFKPGHSSTADLGSEIWLKPIGYGSNGASRPIHRPDASTTPLAQKLKAGGARVPDVKADSLENAIDVVRQSEIGVFHPCGSCGMRPKDRGGVVDTNLRVYGVRGLRVVDASIFPLVPVGNIQSAVYAVAEKAADIIKAERRQ